MQNMTQEQEEQDAAIIRIAQSRIMNEPAYLPGDEELSAVMRACSSAPPTKEQKAAQVAEWVEAEFRYPCPIDNPIEMAEWAVLGYPEDYDMRTRKKNSS